MPCTFIWQHSFLLFFYLLIKEHQHLFTEVSWECSHKCLFLWRSRKQEENMRIIVFWGPLVFFFFLMTILLLGLQLISNRLNLSIDPKYRALYLWFEHISCSVVIFVVILSYFNHKCFNSLNMLKLSEYKYIPTTFLYANLVM